MGTVVAPTDAAQCRQFAVAGLCRGISFDAGLSLLQSRRAADRRQPRGTLFSSDSGIRLGDGDLLSRRAAALVSSVRLWPGADRRLCGVAPTGSAIMNRPERP